MFYTFHFICIDKSDEYQLVKFILSFKKAQFITLGCFNAILGYILYYRCVHLNLKYDEENQRNQENSTWRECQEHGPGADIPYFFYDVFVFILQLLLVWLAFLMLPCSKSKGRPNFKWQKEQNQKGLEEKGCCCCSCNRGGLLKILMIWDLVAFCISVGLFWLSFLYMQFDSGDQEHYNSNTQYLFFAKVIYGLLSFPFLLFIVEPLANLLSKCKKTGYDLYGNTLPYSQDVKVNYSEEYLRDSEIKVNIDDMILYSDSDEEKKKKS